MRYRTFQLSCRRGRRRAAARRRRDLLLDRELGPQGALELREALLEHAVDLVKRAIPNFSSRFPFFFITKLLNTFGKYLYLYWYF